jgi:hypothetical protein
MYACDVCGQIKYQNIHYHFNVNTWRQYDICDDYCLDNLKYFQELHTFCTKEQLIPKIQLFLVPSDLRKLWQIWIGDNPKCIDIEKNNNKIVKIIIPKYIFYSIFNSIKQHTKDFNYVNRGYFSEAINYWVFLQEDELWDNQLPYDFIQNQMKCISARERFINEIGSSLSS